MCQPYIESATALSDTDTKPITLPCSLACAGNDKDKNIIMNV